MSRITKRDLLIRSDEVLISSGLFVTLSRKRESNKPILNLAVAMQQRAWMQGLWDDAKIFDFPPKFEPIYSP